MVHVLARSGAVLAALRRWPGTIPWSLSTGAGMEFLVFKGSLKTQQFEEKSTEIARGDEKRAPARSGALRRAPACSGVLRRAPARSGALRRAPACSGALRRAPGSVLVRSGAFLARSGALRRAPACSGALRAVLRRAPACSGVRPHHHNRRHHHHHHHHHAVSLNSNGSEFNPVCDTRCGQRERGQRAAALESSRSFYLRVAGGGLGRSPFPPAKEGKRLPYVRSGGGWGVLVEKRCPRRRPRDMCMYVYVYVCKCICMYMHLYVYVYV